MVMYICIEDKDGEGFHVGDVMTAKGWKEWAMSLNDYGEFDDEFKEFFVNSPPEETLDHIMNIWGIEIVEYDNNNKEHKALKENYEANTYA